MENEQVGNTDMVPESEIQESVFNEDASSDFFEGLEQSVNSGIQEEQELPQSTSENIGDNTPSSPSEVQPQDDNDVLQKRYSDSSREAKRLNGKLNELEPYMPILDAMREDPNLIQHVRNYFEGGGQAPQTMTEKLQLSEDFMFDADDAFGKPDSDSARVLGATVDGIVQQRLGQALKGQKAENQRLTKETTFRNKHEMSDDEWNDFVSYAKGKSLELDDIYYLKNRQNRDTKIADDARKQVATQMKKAQDQPRSLATAGSVPVEKTQDDSVFDAIVGLDSELESAFG
tara:strand:+ start:189 stop:1052 length:864 start_codon:yes stop_codon:yes gene_type:complete